MASSSPSPTAIAICLAAGLLRWTSAAALEVGAPILVSRTSSGSPAVGFCTAPHFARGTARFVAFHCQDPLVPDDTNLRADTYLVDRQLGLIERISLTSQGTEVGYDSYSGFPSSDGRFVALDSRGPLHPDGFIAPVLNFTNVFLRDRLAGTTEFISRNVDGNISASSVNLQDALADQAEVLLQTQSQLLDPDADPFLLQANLYIRNWHTGAIELVSQSAIGTVANGASGLGRLSTDARHVVFGSSATNLPGAPADGVNLYLRDRLAGTSVRLTRPWHGGEFLAPISVDIRAPSVSIDGRHVAFASTSTELLQKDAGLSELPRQVYVLDRATGHLERISDDAYGTPADRPCSSASISDAGHVAAFYCEATNLSAGGRAIYVVDRTSGQGAAVTGALGSHVGSPPTIDLARDASAIAFSWRSADPASPYFNRSLIFTVELRGTAPPASPARPVPSGPGGAWLALAALALIAAAWRYRPAR